MPESNTPSSKPPEEPPSGVLIQLANRQEGHAFDATRLSRAAGEILSDHGFDSGHLSLVVVCDSEMHQLNRQYLDHDYPTDVLSFLLESEGDHIEGEVIASADTAKREAESIGWQLDDELLLYVIHGTLHLVGMDDHSPADRREMRTAEAHYLSRFGLEHRFDDAEATADEEMPDANSLTINGEDADS